MNNDIYKYTTNITFNIINKEQINDSDMYFYMYGNPNRDKKPSSECFLMATVNNKMLDLLVPEEMLYIYYLPVVNGFLLTGRMIENKSYIIPFYKKSILTRIDGEKELSKDDYYIKALKDIFYGLYSEEDKHNSYLTKIIEYIIIKILECIKYIGPTSEKGGNLDNPFKYTKEASLQNDLNNAIIVGSINNMYNIMHNKEIFDNIDIELPSKYNISVTAKFYNKEFDKIIKRYIRFSYHSDNDCIFIESNDKNDKEMVLRNDILLHYTDINMPVEYRIICKLLFAKADSVDVEVHEISREIKKLFNGNTSIVYNSVENVNTLELRRCTPDGEDRNYFTINIVKNPLYVFGYLLKYKKNPEDPYKTIDVYDNIYSLSDAIDYLLVGRVHGLRNTLEKLLKYLVDNENIPTVVLKEYNDLYSKKKIPTPREETIVKILDRLDKLLEGKSL